MKEKLYILELDWVENKDGFLFVNPTYHSTKIVLSPLVCQRLFREFYRWGMIDEKEIQLALRRQNYNNTKESENTNNE